MEITIIDAEIQKYLGSEDQKTYVPECM